MQVPKICNEVVTQETFAFFLQLRVVVVFISLFISLSTNKVSVSTRKNSKVFLVGKSGIWWIMKERKEKDKEGSQVIENTNTKVFCFVYTTVPVLMLVSAWHLSPVWR